MTANANQHHNGKLKGALFTECAEWIWEQLQEDGLFLSGELIELILETERELKIHTRQPAEIAQLVDDEFKMRGIATDPAPIDLAIVRTVIEWEDEFLGFAGIQRADS
jgi:hypothetical protein